MSSSSLRLARGAYVGDVTALCALPSRPPPPSDGDSESTRAARDTLLAGTGASLQWYDPLGGGGDTPALSATVFGAARVHGIVPAPEFDATVATVGGSRSGADPHPPRAVLVWGERRVALVAIVAGPDVPAPAREMRVAATLPPLGHWAHDARPLRHDASHPLPPSPSVSPTTPSSSGPSAATTRSPRAVSAAWSARCDPCSIPSPSAAPPWPTSRSPAAPSSTRSNSGHRATRLRDPTRTRTRTSPTPRDDARRPGRYSADTREVSCASRGRRTARTCFPPRTIEPRARGPSRPATYTRGTPPRSSPRVSSPSDTPPACGIVARRTRANDRSSSPRARTARCACGTPRRTSSPE